MTDFLDYDGLSHFKEKLDGSINDETTGINLLRGTRDFREGIAKHPDLSDTASYRADGWNAMVNTQGVKTVDREGFTIFTISSETDTVKAVYSSLIGGLFPGEYFTVSFEFMIEDVSNYKSDNTLFRYDVFREGRSIGGTSFTAEDGGIKNPESGVLYKWRRSIMPNRITSPTDLLLASVRINRACTVHFRKVKIERGSINNPIWSPSPFDIDYINDMTTGINLLRGTRDFRIGTEQQNNSLFLLKDGFYNRDNYKFYKDEEGFIVAYHSPSDATSSADNQGLFTSAIWSDDPESYFTLSGEIMFEGTETFDGNIYLSFRKKELGASTFNQEPANKNSDLFKPNIWIPFVVRAKVSNAEEFYVSGSCSIPKTSSATVRVRKFKLEKGFINNPIWSASPFDVAQASDVQIATPSETLAYIKGSTGSAVTTLPTEGVLVGALPEPDQSEDPDISTMPSLPEDRPIIGGLLKPDQDPDEIEGDDKPWQMM